MVKAIKSLGRKGAMFIYTSLLWTLALMLILAVVEFVASGKTTTPDLKELMTVYGDNLKWFFGIAVGGNSAEWIVRGVTSNTLPDPKAEVGVKTPDTDATDSKT